MESQFTSPFWHYYIVAIVVGSIIWILWLLLSQNVVKVKRGEEVKTMGHSWDGIEEYNNPLPFWWFCLFLGTIAFAVYYLAFYPGLGDFKGIGFNGQPWTSKNQYEREVQAAEAKTGALYAKYAGMSVADVAKDPNAMMIGKNLFNTYCIQCHGSDAQGSRGFPNLTDTDWLYGGTPEKIHETIAKGRTGVMAAWGPVLGEESVKDVANYVMSLSGKEHNQDRAVRGKEIFAANCITCHGADGSGVQGMAPNLTDDTWLWSGSEKGIIETITGGRHNQMPAWEGFLTNEKIHLLTAYVWGKSHPDGNALPTDTKNAVGTQMPTADAAQPTETESVKPATASAVEPAQQETSAPVEPAKQETVAASSVAVASEAVSAPVVQAAAPAADKASVAVENGVVKFYFASGKSDVASDADKAAAEVVKAAKAGKKLVISGFTDSTGNAEINARLSKQRAEAVQAFLKKQGVKAESMTVRKPENTIGAEGKSAEGRRVEVKIQD